LTALSKIQELIRDLKAAGFDDRGGEDSHHNLNHPGGVRITISGASGSDATPYQDKAVKAALEQVRK